FLENAAGESMLNTNLFPNNSLELASFVTSPVFFDGPNTLIANGGTPARMYSPVVFAFGSSIVHLNESTYPAGSGNAMMTPFVSSGEGNHDPGPVMIAILQDLGWQLVDPSTSLQEPTAAELAFDLFPNPSNGRYQFSNTLGELQYRVFSPEGKMVDQGMTNSQTLNIQHLPEGNYFIHLFQDEFEVVRPVVKF
ncbi:MAG: T9SS type A sorting domain-containing protein, partial [Bacteroidota bacterium]